MIAAVAYLSAVQNEDRYPVGPGISFYEQSPEQRRILQMKNMPCRCVTPSYPIGDVLFHFPETNNDHLQGDEKDK